MTGMLRAALTACKKAEQSRQVKTMSERERQRAMTPPQRLLTLLRCSTLTLTSVHTHEVDFASSEASR